MLGDELALEFEEAWSDKKLLNIMFDADEIDILQRIDQALAGMTNLNDTSLWERDALIDRPEWENIRVIARELALKAGWDISNPPTDSTTYIFRNNHDL